MTLARWSTAWRASWLTDDARCQVAESSRRTSGSSSTAWGPLGLGTLIVKPDRHVTSVADLSDAEAAELGPLLRRASAVAEQLVGAEQTYNCLWSHAGGVPVHIHYVVQPVTAEQMAEFEAHGPSLQVAMVSRGETPQESEIQRVADQARQAFASD
jgi:diadenosine tetraphosphate (Ap4A) HIT family hydrolase